jgi:hypothetical protein
MGPSILSIGKVLTCYTKIWKIIQKESGGGSTLISHLVLSNSHDHHLVVLNNIQQLVSPNNARQTNGLTLHPVWLFFWGGGAGECWEEGGAGSNNKSLLIWTLLNTRLWTCLSKATRIGGISTTIMSKLWTYLTSSSSLPKENCLWLNLVLGPLPISISPLVYYCIRTWHKDTLYSFVMLI